MLFKKNKPIKKQLTSIYEVGLVHASWILSVIIAPLKLVDQNH